MSVTNRLHKRLTHSNLGGGDNIPAPNSKTVTFMLLKIVGHASQHLNSSFCLIWSFAASRRLIWLQVRL